MTTIQICRFVLLSERECLKSAGKGTDHESRASCKKKTFSKHARSHKSEASAANEILRIVHWTIQHHHRLLANDCCSGSQNSTTYQVIDHDSIIDFYQ